MLSVGNAPEVLEALAAEAEPDAEPDAMAATLLAAVADVDALDEVAEADTDDWRLVGGIYLTRIDLRW